MLMMLPKVVEKGECFAPRTRRAVGTRPTQSDALRATPSHSEPLRARADGCGTAKNYHTAALTFILKPLSSKKELSGKIFHQSSS